MGAAKVEIRIRKCRRKWLTSIADGVDFTFAIREHVSKQFFGIVGLHCVSTARPELGIWIREERHGQAYGREAVTAVATWGTRTFRPRGYLYPVAEANQASQRIAESLGGVVIDERQTPKFRALVYWIPGANP